LIIEVDDNDKATCLGWTIGDEFIIAGFDSGNIVKYDAATGTVCHESPSRHAFIVWEDENIAFYIYF
jgi:hypothetical protein